LRPLLIFYFSVNHSSPTHISTLSLHDALPISTSLKPPPMFSTIYFPSPTWSLDAASFSLSIRELAKTAALSDPVKPPKPRCTSGDRKSTRLNSSHVSISYAVFCLKKKTNQRY